MSRVAPTVSVRCPGTHCQGTLRLSFAGLGYLLGCGEALRCPDCHRDMRNQLLTKVSPGSHLPGPRDWTAHKPV
jgi:hypothetical protein